MMLIAADQLDLANQFFRIRIIQQEREALNRLIGQPAAARLLPRQMLVKNRNLIPSARQLLAAHRPRRSPADDRYLSHSLPQPPLSQTLPRLVAMPVPIIGVWRPLFGGFGQPNMMGTIAKQKPQA